MPAAIGASEFSTLLLLLVIIVVPIAAIAFARSGRGLRELGKGQFSVDRDDESAQPQGPVAEAAERDEEVRQMVEASNFRRLERGEAELDAEAEIDRLLGRGEQSDEVVDGAPDDASSAGYETAIREEIRQLVVANNERRIRRDEAPLDVDLEVEERLREWS